MELIIAGLNMGNCEDTDKKIRNLSNYMIGRRSYKHEHQCWAAKFYLCEVLNFVNVIFQICFTDMNKSLLRIAEYLALSKEQFG